MTRLAAFLLLALVGCGSSGTVAVVASTSTSTSTSTTSAATTTTVARTTTTVAKLSRDAELAVRKCMASAGHLIGSYLAIGAKEKVDAAETACKDAELQVKTDLPGSYLNVLIAGRIVDLAFAKLKTFDASADLDAIGKDLDAKGEAWLTKMESELAKVS